MTDDEALTVGAPLNCIAFYKGDLLPNWLLEYVVNAAARGYITEAGRKLWLIPISVYERAERGQQAKADREAKRRRKKGLPCSPGPASPSIRKKDCIPLSSFLPPNRRQRRLRLSRINDSGPLFSIPPETVSVTPVYRIGKADKRNANCHRCGASLAVKRRGAKYCGPSCKQAEYRTRGMRHGR